MGVPRHNPILGQLSIACSMLLVSLHLASCPQRLVILEVFWNFSLKTFFQRHRREGAIWCNNQQCCVNMVELNVITRSQFCRMAEQDSLTIAKCLYSALKTRILPSFSGSKLGQSVPRIYISIKYPNNKTLCL